MRLYHKLAIGPIQTVGAVSAVVLTFAPGSFSPVVNDCIIGAVARLIGKNAGGNGIRIPIIGCLNVVAGVVTLEQSSPGTPVGNATLTTATGFFDVHAGTIIQLNATGIAAQTINWTGWVEFETTEF